MKQKCLLEVCCGSLADVQQAVDGGAERVELCAALSVDGLTPSMGLIEEVRQLFPQLTLHVLIRPREGNFVYSDAEKEIIYMDIRHAVKAGADGIVCGALTADGGVDVLAVRKMLQCCVGKPFTFHRAFDVCHNPLEALSELKALGVSRILTSGQESNVIAGIPLLRQLVQTAQGNPIIMPGGGMDSDNVVILIQSTGAIEVHGSCRKKTTSTSAAEVAQILSLIGE